MGYVKIKLKPVIISIVILGLILSCNHKEKAPNVIFVFADQWRSQAMGYMGNTDVKTPNLDQLAEENIIFTTAISNCPVCSPTRASILSGQYPLTHGVFYNDKPLGSEVKTIAEVYKEHGYITGYIGKWHLNGHPEGENTWEHRTSPVPKNRRQGFDYWSVLECTHDYNNSFYYDENNKKHFWEGYDAEVQTDSAITFIHRNKNNHFLLFLSWGPPHEPYHTAPEKYQKIYSNFNTITLRPNVPDTLNEEARKMISGYYAHCTALDEYIGKLQNAIYEAGIEKNTIFVFTSDHGDMLLSHGKEKKQQPWDESILVPFILKYPAEFDSPKTVSIPFSTPDIMPTLLGLCNLPIPEKVEGVDFSRFLSGNEKSDIKAGLIMCPVPFHQWSREKGGREYRGIRTEKYTYVTDLNGEWLLYDNLNDPYQMNNLITNPEYNEIKKHLEDELKKLLNRTNDDFKKAEYYMDKWNYAWD